MRQSLIAARRCRCCSAAARRLRRRLVRAELPDVGAARTYELVDFEPAAPVPAGKPTTVSFVIRQPDGKPLTTFKRGAGPHTGVHLIFVRRRPRDDHPPAPADRGRRDDPRDGHVPRRRAATGSSSTPIRTTGPQPNFQLFQHGPRRRRLQAGEPLPPPRAVGRRATATASRSRARPTLKAIQAGLLDVDVTDPQGQAGALHAVLRRARARDLLPQGARSTTSTRTSARPARAAARARSAARRSPARSAKPGPADGRRARPGAGHVAAVPPDASRRPRPDGAVHPRRQP